MAFLYDVIQLEFGKRVISQVPVPNSITDNLKPGFGQRPYQIESFQRYILCHTEDFEGRPKKPFHLLYNMATGSGKTLVMAGLILYLYEKGFRNFLFFVNSNNIIKKTKDNFLNPQASKYLFSDKIVIDGKEVYLKETDTFESADDKNINIKKPILNSSELFNPNIVKVVTQKNGLALYFSRHSIPYIRSKSEDQWTSTNHFYRHIGIYAFRANVVKELSQLKPSEMEIAESLEQLRWLENGYKIHVSETNFVSPAIDTPEDLLTVDNFLKMNPEMI